MSVILSIPTLGLIAILQSAVVSRLPLNRGTADLMLVVLVAIALQKTVSTSWQWSIVGGLFMDYLSGLPFGIFTVSYLLATGLALIIRERIWRFSFLMQLLVVFFGTMFSHALSFLVLFLQGSEISLGTVLQVVTLPSIILNFMISLPIFILTQDILEQVNPQE
ncbi:MAG: rod shape-determining protein MreD [Chloroflexota bacterium]|nr:MAG: rod shape-determining protein MreD [Chloroflexota bacterium]